ncbi:hypothetical protein, partial [Nafulsella turpanensis]|uniref:hypothetical protein n=1 Tax=Nafulsella turpanensis TaxID=1265690 RepID=UPI0004784316
MRKFYLYTFLLICLFGAGFALAANHNLLVFNGNGITSDFLNRENKTEAVLPAGESISASNCNNLSATVKTVKNQTSCKTPNGKLDISIKPANGSYTIEWYESGGLLDPDYLVGTGTSVDKLVSGTYFAVVKDTQTGCQTIVSGTVNDETPKIEQKINVINDVIGCQGAQTGILEIEIITEDGSNNVKTIWMTGSEVDFGQEIPKWKNMLEANELPKGTFTVISVNNNTGCYSEPFTITIGQVTPPVISGSATASTSCATGNGTISITAQAAEGSSIPENGFTFTWYKGSDTSGTPIGNATNTSTTSALGNLLPGFYTVQVNNNPDDGTCVSYQTFEVLDHAVYPSLTFATTPNEVCTPLTATTAYNGSITANMTENGPAGSSYTYSLHDAAGVFIRSSTTNSFTGLRDGNYQVKVKNNTSGCESALAPVTVGVATPAMGVTLSAKPQTNCEGASNGSATASVTKNGAPVTSGYTISWYTGTTATGTPIASGNTASALAGGQSYTVKITDTQSGCTATASVSVPLAKAIPSLTFATTPNEVCTPLTATTAYNGSITANMTENGPAGSSYTYSLHDAAGVFIRSSTTNSFTGLRDGNYQVKVKNNTSGCESALAPVTVGVATPAMGVTLSAKPQTNCEGASNGSATASVTKNGAPVTSGYTISWYTGTTATGTPIASGNTASALAGGQSYTVKITDTQSGCTATASVSVPLAKAIPSLTFATTPNEVCTPLTATTAYNGSITANMTENGPAGSSYTYSLLDATGKITTSSTDSFTGLRDGNYQVKVKNNTSGCESALAPVTVGVATPAMGVTLSAKPQTNCEGASNGSATASVTKNGAPVTSGYTISWYTGTTATGTPIASGNTASALAGGQSYTVKITDTQSGCTATASVSVPLAKAIPSLTFATTPNEVCTPLTATTAYNGSITANMTENGPAGSSYTYSLLDATGKITTSSTGSFTGLRDGNYQVKVKNNTSGCESALAPVTVAFAPPTLELSLNPNSQTNCTGTPNGSATAEVSKNGSIVTSGFTLSWYNGTTATGTPIASGTGISSPSLTGGQDYTVKLVDTQSGCVLIETVNIPLEKSIPALTLIPTANTVCAPTSAYPYTGKIEAILTEGGNTISSYSGYTFTWRNESGTEVTSSGTNGNIYSGLVNGNYQVKVKNDLSGCESPFYPVTVGFAPPALGLTLNPTAETHCSSPNGTITAMVTGTSNYDLFWFIESPSSGNAIPETKISGNVASGLAGNVSYSVKLVDKETGCEKITYVGVPQSFVYPAVDATVVNNDVCNPSLAEGEAYTGSIIANVTETGSHSYTYRWFKYNGIDYDLISGENAASLNNIADGTYKVQAINNTTGCPSTTETVVVGADKVLPQATVSTTPQTSCDLINLLGSATAQVSNGVIADYTFEWFSGNSINPANLITSNLSNGGATVSGLAEGDYIVRITNKTSGCQSTAMGNVGTQQEIPVASLQVTTDISCTQNGQLTASVSNPGTNTFTYKWYRGKAADPAKEITSNTDPSLDLLDNGDPLPSDYYTVVAINTVTKCASQPVTKYLAPPAAPFVIKSTVNNKPSSCNQKEGIATVWVDNGSGVATEDVAGEYTFEWFKGTPLDPNASFYSAPAIQFDSLALELDPANQSDDPALATFMAAKTPAQVNGVDYFNERTSTNGQTIYKRESGIYTVVVTRLSDQCKALLQVPIPFEDAHESLAIDISHSDECNGLGTINSQVKKSDGTIPAQSNYTFYLFRGTSTGDLSAADYSKKGVGDAGDANATTTFPDLSPGFYTLLAKEDMGTFCISVAEVVEVKQVALSPVANVTDINPMTNCEGDNGSFILNIGPGEYEPGEPDYFTTEFKVTLTDPDGNIQTYTETAFDTATEVTRPISLSGLTNGSYSIFVEGFKSDGSPTGCDTTIVAQVGKNAPTPVLRAKVTNQQTTCNFNGAILLEGVDITFNGTTTSYPVDFTAFDFVYYKSEADYLAKTSSTAISSASISGLEAGTYYLVATKKVNSDPSDVSDGCSSLPVILNIEDKAIPPTISFSYTSDENCSATDANGTLTATMTSSTGADIDSVHWFTGESIDPADRFTGTVITLSANQQRIEGLQEGFYTAQVFEGGCETIKSFRVPGNKATPLVSVIAAPTPNTVCDASQYNGSFEIKELSYNGTFFNTEADINSNFDFVIYTSESDYNSGTNPNPGTANMPDTLAPGTYYVVASKTTYPGIGCVSVPSVITIPDQPVYPLLSVATTREDDSCDD